MFCCSAVTVMLLVVNCNVLLTAQCFAPAGLPASMECRTCQGKVSMLQLLAILLLYMLRAALPLPLLLRMLLCQQSGRQYAKQATERLQDR
jgi:hypothetical protein